MTLHLPSSVRLKSMLPLIPSRLQNNGVSIYGIARRWFDQQRVTPAGHLPFTVMGGSTMPVKNGDRNSSSVCEGKSDFRFMTRDGIARD
jgi:hypothetical protein